MEKRRIGDILVERNLITREQLAEALEVQRLTPAPLGSILAHLGFVEEDRLIEALADEYAVRPWDLKQRPADPRAVEKLPADISRSYKVLPVAIDGGTLVLAMTNPEDVEALDMVRYSTRMNVEPVVAARHRLLQAINDVHGGESLTEYGQLIDRAVKGIRQRKNEEVEEVSAEAVPVVTLVNQILLDGIKAGASDIHIEPGATKVEVRFRVDGQIRKSSELPVDLLQSIAIRLKIMADLDIVEHRLPMDGRLSMQYNNRPVDLRLSVLPSHFGPRLVIRVLDKVASLRQPEELGMSPHNLRLFRHLITRPYGMVLVTGPTGSGKTTTLYSAVLELRRSALNIMTCEDPIEYEIDGISQSQVNESVGLSFDRHIVALMRQDPDVIMIGEIRDSATAQVAVRGALTGHLMLSTLQCNDAVSAIPRLIELQVDPYLLSTSLSGITSQRLVRMLCLHCKKARAVTGGEADTFRVYGMEPPETVAVPGGCPSCSHLGFRGRNAIHEIVPVTSEVSRLIAGRASVDAIRDSAKRSGFVPMQVRALELVAKGATTFEEAQRTVALEPDYDTFVEA